MTIADTGGELAAALKEKYEAKHTIALRLDHTSDQYSIENYRCEYYHHDNQDKLTHHGHENFSSFTNKANVLTIINNKNNVIIRKGRYIAPDVLTLVGITLPITSTDFTKRTFIYEILGQCTLSVPDENTIVATYDHSGEIHTMHFSKAKSWRLARRNSKSRINNMNMECDIILSYAKDDAMFPVSVKSRYDINGEIKSSTTIIQELAIKSSDYAKIFSIELKPNMKVIDEITGKVAIVDSNGKVDYRNATMLKRIAMTGAAPSGGQSKQSLEEGNSFRLLYYSLALLSCVLIIGGLIMRRRLSQ